MTVDDAKRFWTAVKFDMDEKRVVEEYNAWYSNLHVPDVVEREGFFKGWRTGEAADAPSIGASEQEFWAIYLMDDLDRMRMVHAGPNAGGPPRRTPPPPPAGTDPKRLVDAIFRKLMSNWGRPFYEVLSWPESDAGSGKFFYREEFNLDGDDAAHDSFERHCRDVHLPEVLKTPGVHRAWQLRHVATDLQVGPDPAGVYMHLFEVDEIDTPIGDRLEGWSTSGATLELVGSHYAHLLSETDHVD